MPTLRAKWFGFVVAWCLTAPALAQESVSQQIDAAIVQAAGGPVADKTNDYEFCRRITLDLHGRIPTVSELEAFVADAASEKRAKLVDTMLASPEFARHMRDVWHVMLMERLGEHPEWLTFLETAFAENRPWPLVVRQILNPNPDEEQVRGAGLFLAKRLENYGQNPVDLPGLTRDVGRFFLGVDLQCAQCHDHLFIDDYRQVDFQGLHTFVSHLTLRQDVKFPAVAEKVIEKKTDFMSVFIKEPRQTGPRLPFQSEVEIVVFAKGEEFAVPPDRTTKFPGQPKFSPLQILAESLPTLENPWFVKNAVNRWWWLLMGRGLVHPLDLAHAGNPPSHPEVLDLLAREFREHQGDVRWLIKTLVLTDTYQRSSRMPAGEESMRPAPDRFAVALERPLSPEQLADSLWRATGHDEPASDDVRKLFVGAFANPPREPEGDFAPSVKAALYLSHNTKVLDWVKTAPEQMQLTTGDGDFASRLDRVWKTVLSRPADPEELAAAGELRSRSADDLTAYRQVIWALLNSTEFCLNH